MNTKTLKTLEYDKVINILAELSHSKMAYERLISLKPFSDINQINKLQDELTDAKRMLLSGGEPSGFGIENMEEILKRLGIGASLNIPEMIMALHVLEGTSLIKQYRHESKVGETSIDALFDSMVTLIDIQNEIRKCIVSEEIISDDASTELKRIRKEMRLKEGKIRDRLNEMITSQTYRSLLQDPVVTLKEDRFCIPVKAEMKGQIEGVIHGESSSGSTVFIEPLPIVQMNNEIKKLEHEEKVEIEKILARLSERLAENRDTVRQDYENLIQLDTLFAKAKLSKKMDATRPVFNSEWYVELKFARHPLIDSEKVVPIDIWLGKDFTTMVITGPNTGGKTVTLKTLGLCVLLGQSGLHIPAYDNSTIPVFTDIFSDIGDEQSIEQSLSTFSSHMKNIIGIMEKINETSLVLLDELGAGTDPVEGAALAMGILKKLKQRNIRTVATTHYSELKHYALTQEGVTNASCEFDLNTLQPTYKLIIGLPGRSNAFLISKKLGLSDEILALSKEELNDENTKFEDVLKNIEDNKQMILLEKEKIDAYKREIEEKKEELERVIEGQKQAEARIVEEAREKALAIYEEAKGEYEQLITELKEKASAYNRMLDEKEMARVKTALDQKIRKTKLEIGEEAEERIRTNHKKMDLKPGKVVYISKLDKEGTILKVNEQNGSVLLQVGIMKMEFETKYLFDVKQKQTKEKKQTITRFGGLKTDKVKIAGQEINVIGLYPAEALSKVEKFIDDSLLLNLEEVRIVHGKGKGILKNEIHQFLKNHDQVLEFRLGVYGEGDSGVTIVKLK